MKSTNRNSIIVAVFSVIYFSLCYTLTISWYRSGYLGVYNIFFDADPSANLDSLAHGWGRHAVAHAFLEIFALPIRVLEVIIFRLGLISNRFLFREMEALLISPAFSTATNMVFYKTLRLASLKIFDAVIITLIFAFSFSNLLFAIIPETFAISCFLISLLFYYYFLCRSTDSRGNPAVWLTIAIALAGITITNIGIFAVVYAAHLRVREKRTISNSIVRPLVYSAASVAVVITYYNVIHFLMKVPKGAEGNMEWIAIYLSTSFSKVVLNLTNFLSASLNSFVATMTSVAGTETINGMECNLLSFTRRPGDILWMVPVFLFFIIIAFNTRKHIKSEKWRELYLLSILVIAYNFVLHGFFGREIFVYTQHWIVPLTLLMVPILSGRRVLSVLILILVLLINLDFLFGIDQLIS